MLKHHADVRAQFGQIRFGIADIYPIDKNFTLLKRFQPVNCLNQSGLSGARGAANDNDFAFFNTGGAIFKYLKGFAVPFADVLNLNHWHGLLLPYCA